MGQVLSIGGATQTEWVRRKPHSFRELLEQARAEISEGVDPAKTFSLLIFPTQRDEKNRTILHDVLHGESTLIDHLMKIPGMRINALTNMINGFDTPMHEYCDRGNMHGVVKLIMHGAIIDRLDASKRTPADRARAAKHYMLADFLDNITTLSQEQRVEKARKIHYLSPIFRVD